MLTKPSSSRKRGSSIVNLREASLRAPRVGYKLDSRFARMTPKIALD